MGLVREITDSNFENEVLKSQNISIVDFWAPWCGPCRKMSVVIDEVANEFEGRINVFKINTDENLKSAKEYSISGLPSILIFKGGKAIERLVGLMTKNTLANNTYSIYESLLLFFLIINVPIMVKHINCINNKNIVCQFTIGIILKNRLMIKHISGWIYIP